MVNFKTRYNNFTTFKTLINAIGGNSAVENSDASWYTILYAKYKEYNLRYKESEADAELYARWQQFKNVFVKVLQAQKNTLENVIKSTNAQAIVDGDQDSVNLDNLLNDYFTSGNSNQLKPAILSVIGPYINQSNVIEELYRIFADFFANVNTDTTVKKTNPFNVHKILNDIMGINVVERIENLEESHITGDVKTALDKKADKSDTFTKNEVNAKVITNQQKSDISSNKNALQQLAPKVQTNENNISTNQTAINTNTVNITANDNDITKLNTGLTQLTTRVKANEDNKATKTALNNYYDKTTSDARFEAKGSGSSIPSSVAVFGNTKIELKKPVDLNSFALKRSNILYSDIVFQNFIGNLLIGDLDLVSGKQLIINFLTSSIIGSVKRTPADPKEFIQKWWYEQQRDQAIAKVSATVREATGQQHLGYFFWTSAGKSQDRKWTENGDSSGLLGIEKNNDKYFLDSSNTNIFKQGKNYDIQINIFKNGGNNSSGQQLNLFATALNNPGSSQIQQDTLGVVQTFDTYQHPPGNNFGPSQTNKNWIIREPAWDFDDFNELTIKIRVRKLSNNQLVIRTTEPVRHFTKRNDGSYLYTRSDFVVKISNTGNGKFWKFGIRTGNWDNITRMEFFIRGEA